MSYFVCMSCPGSKSELLSIFKPDSKPSPFHLTDMNDTPVGKIVQNGKSNAYAFIVTYGLYSEHLVDKCPPRDGASAEFIVKLKQIRERYGAFTFLLHFFRGMIVEERLKEYKTVMTSFDDFIRAFPNVEEDVVYVVSTPPPPATRRHGKNKFQLRR